MGRAAVGEACADDGPAHVEAAEQAAGVDEQAAAAGDGDGHGLALAHVEDGEADVRPAVFDQAQGGWRQEQEEACGQGGAGQGAAGGGQGQGGEQAVAAEQFRPGGAQDGVGDEQALGVYGGQGAHEPGAAVGPGVKEQGGGLFQSGHGDQGCAAKDQRHDQAAEDRQPQEIDPGVERPVAKEPGEQRQDGGFGADAGPKDAKRPDKRGAGESLAGDASGEAGKGRPKQGDAGHGQGRELQAGAENGQGRDD